MSGKKMKSIRWGYHDFIHHPGRPEKDAALAEIIAEPQERSFHIYGCRKTGAVQTVNLGLDAIRIAVYGEKRGPPRSCGSTAASGSKGARVKLYAQLPNAALCTQACRPYRSGRLEKQKKVLFRRS